MLDRVSPSTEKRPRHEAAKRPLNAWGVGRVAFFARIDTIRAELAQGWPLTMIYARHKDALGIGYKAFWRLVDRHAADVRPVPLQAVNDEPKRVRYGLACTSANDTSATGPRPLPTTTPPFEGPDAHAGHRPPRTFIHDPIERPGDYERLFGERKR